MPSLLLVEVEVSSSASSFPSLAAALRGAAGEGVVLGPAVEATSVSPCLGDTLVLLLRALLPPLVTRTVSARVRTPEVVAAATVATVAAVAAATPRPFPGATLATTVENGVLAGSQPVHVRVGQVQLALELLANFFFGARRLTASAVVGCCRRVGLAAFSFVAMEGGEVFRVFRELYS